MNINFGIHSRSCWRRTSLAYSAPTILHVCRHIRLPILHMYCLQAVVSLFTFTPYSAIRGWPHKHVFVKGSWQWNGRHRSIEMPANFTGRLSKCQRRKTRTFVALHYQVAAETLECLSAWNKSPNILHRVISREKASAISQYITNITTVGDSDGGLGDDLPRFLVDEPKIALNT